MSKRIWTESRQIEASDSTQNKRCNWGQSEGNQGKSNQGNRMAIGSQSNRDQSRAIKSQLAAIGINRGQSVAIRGNLGAIGDNQEAIRDKLEQAGGHFK